MYRVGLLLVCLLAFALRLHLLEDVSLHEDEAISQHRYIQPPLYNILTHYTSNNHWLTNLFGYFLAQLGPQRFFLRWSSLFLGTLAIPLLGLVGRRLFKSQRDGFIAGLLLCLSAFHVEWSQQFRGYSALHFFVLLSFLWLARALQTGHKRYWLGFLVANALAIVSHLYGVLTLLIAAVITALWPGAQSAALHLWRRHATTRERWSLQSCPFALSLLALVLISYFIWFGKTQIIDLEHAVPQVSLIELVRYQWLAFKPTLADVQDFLIELAMTFTAQPGARVALFLFWGLGLGGLALSAHQFLPSALLLGSWFIIPIAVVVTADFAIPGFFVFERYLIFILPAWLLLAARTLSLSCDWLASRITSARRRRLAVSLALLLITLAYLGWFNIKAIQFYFAERAGHDWRAAAGYLANHTGPADLIVCKQLPHRWPPRRLDLGDPCTKELTYRLAELEMTPRFPIKQLEIIASFNTGLRFKDQAGTRGAVWLVLWGKDIPLASTQPNLRPTAITFNHLGHIIILKTEAGSSLVANLGDALGYLTHLDTTSPDRFDYYLRRAQILGYQGKLTEAGTLLSRARTFLNGETQALSETEKIIELMAAQLDHLPPTLKHPLNLDFGRPAVLRLAGYNLPATVQPGQAIPATLFWQPLAAVPADYTIFLHLRDVTSRTVAQLDFQPFDGVYPTSQWLPGVTIEETRLWSMPDDLPPGAYDLHLGLYQAGELKHLPVAGSQVGENSVLLGQVRVVKQ